jgi:hypothetical protein
MEVRNMPNAKCIKADVWESWFSRNPLMRGHKLGDVPVAWLDWLLDAPALVLDGRGALTSLNDPDAIRVETSHCRLRSQRGSVILETALCVPILLMIVLGGIDVLWAVKTKGTLDYIAEQSAKCIVTHGCDPQTLAANNAGGLGLNPARLTVTIDAGAATATAVYQFEPVGPVFPAITLQSTASGAQ